MKPFKDRYEAGRRLATQLTQYAGRDDVLVLALPRGGVPVGYEVARALQVPLDAFVVRKLGLPGNEELAMGAIASGGTRFLNEQVVRLYGVDLETLEAVAEQEGRELRRREQVYRGQRPFEPVTGRVVILVDDGIATGASIAAAARALRAQHPARLIIAAPVAPPDAIETLQREADEVVVWMIPDDLDAIGRWYVDFTPTTDDEVQELLMSARDLPSITSSPNPQE